MENYIICPKICPKCTGKMYAYYSDKTITLQAVCYICGFYWSSSSVYPECKYLENMIIDRPFLLKTIISNPKINL